MTNTDRRKPADEVAELVGQNGPVRAIEALGERAAAVVSGQRVRGHFGTRPNSKQAKRPAARLVIRLDPKHDGADYNRGVSWERKGEPDNAIKDCTEAIRLNPKYTAPYNNRARLRATCPSDEYRDDKAALEDAKRASELSGWKVAGYIDTPPPLPRPGTLLKRLSTNQRHWPTRSSRRNTGRGP
jgi:hypothetical protein